MDILEVLRESDFTTTVEMVTLEVNTQQCQKRKYDCCHEIGNSCMPFLSVVEQNVSYNIYGT